ncbi:penicillin amidase [Bryocella elongata]|uniref:Penicillin amidase n=2 Tax=Bryocella elongata TaxID=863522 RepID=A0A1H5WRD2_9BACT|nr:penicillin amidase [Bryocella elongata]
MGFTAPSLNISTERMSLNPNDPRHPSRDDTASREPRLVTRSLREELQARRDDRDLLPEHRGLFSRLSELRLRQARNQREDDRPGRTRRLKLIGLSTAALLLLIVVLLSGSVLYLRHRLHTSLPELDGQLQATGLGGEVIITRDPHGVPSLQAQSLDDVLFAQGYVTAQDRMWQMDALRRHGAGELAEILGPALVDHDRSQRILQLGAAAERAVAALPPDQRHQLEVYAKGVNAYLDSHADRLPVEFAALHYKPAPWTPRDSMLVVLCMWQDLATSFPTKIAREALAQHLPAQLLGDLYPVGSWRDRPPSQPQPDLTQQHEEIEQVPLDKTQSLLQQPNMPSATPRDIVRVAENFEQAACEDCRSGSNNWVVAGSRSASGAPLVSNDMHLGLTAPDIWYEAGLHVKALDQPESSLDVAGFTLPGVPFVIVGRNAHVAWGFTAMLGDVQDVRIEHTRGTGDRMEFQRVDGSWAPVAHRHELIRVRGGRDVKLDVLLTEAPLGSGTMATPIISPIFPGEKRMLSLAWTAYDPQALQIPGLAMDTAANGTQLVAAFGNFGGPTLSAVWGDDAGHIGYHALGRIPVRGPAMQHPRDIQQPMTSPLNLDNNGALPADEEAEADDSEDGSDTAPQMAPPSTGASPEHVAPKPGIDYTIGSAIAYKPVDALDPGQAWSGYVPYDKLPSVTDPTTGYLATANARVTPDDYPFFLSGDWVDAYRVERITTLLKDRQGLTPADMLAIQNDDYSDLDRTVAQKLAYAIDHTTAVHDRDRMKQAAELLRRWDGHMDPDSPAAAIVLATRDVLWPVLLTAKIAEHDHVKADSSAAREGAKLYLWAEKTTALEMLLARQPARWLPKNFASWNDLLAVSVDRALREAGAPHDLNRWKLAQYHSTEIAHPVFGSHTIMSRLLGVATGSGLQPVRGDATTVRASGLHFGPSERFDADLKDSDATLGNITTGQSGSPASPWYLDQFHSWLVGESFPLALQHPKVEHTLKLEP